MNCADEKEPYAQRLCHPSAAAPPFGDTAGFADGRPQQSAGEATHHLLEAAGVQISSPFVPQMRKSAAASAETSPRVLEARMKKVQDKRRGASRLEE